MRLSPSISLLFIAEQCAAFHLLPFTTTRRQHEMSLAVAETSPEKKSLSAADILARARKAAGVPEDAAEEEGPKLFDDDLVDDMQQVLLTLEKRVKEGPGSVSLLEVEEFQAMTGRILNDMKEKEATRLSELASGSSPVVPAKPAIASAAPPTVSAPVQMASSNAITDEEGPAYDGKGGMGLAQGTVNTWVIPGMDEMSPEEYQAAIQKSVSDRQAKRKETGIYGNRATNDYLNDLNGQSSGGMVK
eukprot:scaffold22596_cov131-Cylindrotheca_fusiformis.AAC.3